MANVWMHCGPLMVNADKMSKSLGNFLNIRQTIALPGVTDSDAAYQANPREAEMLRFFIVRNHYRSTQNFAADNLFDAQQAIDRLYQTLANVVPDEVIVDWSAPAAQRFAEAMDDDFNTAGAIAVLFELSSLANREHCSASAGLMRALGGVLGLLQSDPAVYLRSPSRYLRDARPTVDNNLGDDEIQALIDQRSQAKADRDFALADRLRDQLNEQGIELEDKAGGVTQWRRA